ncbi:right-handed parallel beta-helix repeat-containing protein [Methanobrevibacter sp. DSM 116169]|uniref:right-handed parallel beta-helix repeat-containing protein n=1 Tax=Methanobrevibacter sp. DSM 116169 TaxID=3242727 RepID=UPI0038FC4B61
MILFIIISLNSVNANDMELIENNDEILITNSDLNLESEVITYTDSYDVYVNSSSTSSTEDGSKSNPYKTISGAVSGSPTGGSIFIANGEYVESGKISISGGDFSFIGENKDNVIIKKSTNTILFECTASNVKLSFYNLIFSGINSGTGSSALIRIGGNQDVIVDNCNFYNFAGKYGAIQLWTTGTGNITNCNFINGSVSVTAGAGLYLSGAGKYNIINSNFKNIRFTPASGYMYGVIYIDNTASVTSIVNSTITNCEGVANSIIYSRGKLSVYDSIISNCEVEKSAYSYQGESLIYTANTGNIEIKDSIITNNTLASYLFYNKNLINIKNSAVYNNTMGDKIVYNEATISSSEVWWGQNTLPDLGTMSVSDFIIMKANNITTPVNMGDSVDITVNFYVSGNNKVANIPDGVLVDFKSDDGTLNASSTGTENGIAKISFTPSKNNENILTAVSGNQSLKISVMVSSPVGIVYVSKSGNDGNNGSINSPVATIKKAIELASMGSGQIIIKEGTYLESALEIRNNLNITGQGNVIIDANGGRAFRIYGVNVLLSNLYFINGNETYSGSVIRVDSGSSLTIDSCIFNKNGGVNNQALIQVSGSNITLLNSIFENNTANPTGTSYGNIYITNGNLYADNCNFTNNHNKYGVFYISGSVAEIYNCVFDSNNATSSSGGLGAGIYFSGSSSAGTTAIVENCTFINNFANRGTSTFGDSAVGKGGAIYVNGNSTVTISNSYFENNTVADGSAGPGEGGAIHSMGGEVLIIGSIFKNNIANNGSEIFVKYNSNGKNTLNITNSIIVDDNENRIASIPLAGTVTVIANTNWWGTNNDPSNFVSSDVVLDNWIILSVSSTNITDNSKIGDVIEITAEFNKYTDKNGNNFTLMDNSIFDGWVVNFTSSTGALSSFSEEIANGIAKVKYTINNDNNKIDVAVNNQTFSIEFKITVYEGIIYVSKDGNDGNDGSINSPVATIKKAIELAKKSGQIIILEGTYLESDLTINYDLNITGQGDVTIDGEYKDNIFLIFSNVLIENIKFTRGQATTSSGAIFINLGNLTLKNTSLFNSKSSQNGGAIYNTGNLVIIDSKLINNSADNLGGAIYMDKNTLGDNTLTIVNSIFDGNHVKGTNNKGGGAIYVQAIKGQISIDNSTFSNNYVEGQYSGGAIYSLQCENILINNSNFVNNSANPDVDYGGGAICFIGQSFEQKGTLNIFNTVFLDNVAKGSNAGGAIYIRTSTLNIKNSALINNVDSEGVAIYRGTSSYAGTTVNANYNWWGTNNDPSSFVANGITIKQWLVMTFTNTSAIKKGNNVDFIVSLNKYTDGSIIYDYLEKINFARPLTITVNDDELYNGVISNGEYKFNYTISGGSKNFSASIDNETLNITFIDESEVHLIVNNLTVHYKNESALEISLKDYKLNPLGSMIVYIIIDGIRYNVTTDSNGLAYLDIDLKPGYYIVNAYFNGTTIYSKAETIASINVINTIVTKDLTKYYKNASQFNATIFDSAGNPLINKTVTFIINGKEYNRTTNEKGIAILSINLNPGNYTIITINPYDGSNVTNNVTVLSTVFADNVTLFYCNGSKYGVSVIDGEGNPIVGCNVSLNINGVFYDRTTDVNGTAWLNINLNPGTYTITAIHPISGLEIGNVIKVLPTLESEDLVMFYRNGSKYGVTVYDKLGNPIVGRNVSLNINGVFYNRTTDANGTAWLNINLDPGNYTITAEHPVTGLKLGNNIEVLPTVFADDLTKKFGTNDTYDIHVLDGQGKPVNNVNVTININGVMYERTTGSDGIVKLNINLDPNTYIATIMYKGYETSNIVTVRS